MSAPPRAGAPAGDRQVLFVSHEATRTGAPMALLHLLRWLRDNSDLEPEIAILRDGPLTADFAEVGPTTVLGTQVDWPERTRAERWLTDRGRHQAVRRLQVVRLRARIGHLAGTRHVYLNSSESLRVLSHLRRTRTVIAHIHELRAALGWSLGPHGADLLRTRVTHVIAAADCVAENLVRQLDLRPEDITRIYEFVDATRVAAPPERDPEQVRADLGLPPGAHVIGGSGWADWRKGIDLFAQLARAVARAGRGDVHLVWVGGLPEGHEGEQIRRDAARAGAHLHLVGLQSRPHDWYRAFDVLALTSREDPYPLVGLETSLLEVPMVCFDRAGGMVELVRRSPSEGAGETGLVVPYLDVEAMAEGALALIDDPARRAAMGRRAAAIVRRDHEVGVAGPQVLEVIERALAGSAG